MGFKNEKLYGSGVRSEKGQEIIVGLCVMS